VTIYDINLPLHDIYDQWPAYTSLKKEQPEEEVKMKKLSILIISVILMAGLVQGQNEAKALAIAPDVYLANLNHELPGIVESTIINMMIFKLYCPEKNFEKICKKLDELTVKGSTESIRFKAFVAVCYIKYGQDFKWIKEGEYKRGESLYENFYNRLQEMYAGLQNTPENLLSSSVVPANE
jgi:hypothetical protein